MKNRNQYRLLSPQQIKDITMQAAEDLKKYPIESAETLMSFYLNNDAEGLFEVIVDWIQTAEDDVISQINHDLNEDSFDNDQFIPHYGF